MKNVKIYALLLAIVLCMSVFIACGEQDDNDESTSVNNKHNSTLPGVEDSSTEEPGDKKEDDDESDSDKNLDTKDWDLLEIRFYSHGADFAWMSYCDEEGWGCSAVTLDGKVIGKIKNASQYSTTNKNGYTIFSIEDENENHKEYAVVDKSGNIVFSESSLGVSGFIVDGSVYKFGDCVTSLDEGFLMAYSIEETYNSVEYKIGVVDEQGNWIEPLSSEHPFLKKFWEGDDEDIEYRIESAEYVGNGIISAVLDRWGYLKYYYDVTDKAWSEELEASSSNQYEPEIIHNERGSAFFTLSNSDGYKFDPVKLPEASWPYDLDDWELVRPIQSDGNYYLLGASGYGEVVYCIIDSSGKLINTFEGSGLWMFLSNGVIYTYRELTDEVTDLLFFEVTDTPSSLK